MDTPRPAADDAPIATCPKCRAAMEPVTYQDITVDRCTACHGLWFDILEQRRLRERAGSEVIDDGAPPTASSAPSAAPATRLACPRCTAPMTRLRDVDNRSIEYEYCAVCNGAFFDAGEFRQYKDASFLGTLRGLFRKGG